MRVAAKLSDGSPLLIDRKIGEGHALVFTSALDNIANNLPLAAGLAAVPRSDHRTRWAASAPRPAITKSDRSSICAPRREKGVPVEIVGPGNKRLLSLAESTKATTFQFPSQGFFDIRRANGREELAAVNPDRRESDFAIVPAETLELWKNTGIASKQGPGVDIRREYAGRQGGTLVVGTGDVGRSGDCGIGVGKSAYDRRPRRATKGDGMNPLEGLAQYLDRLERRLRLFAWTRGAAAVVGAALILTVVIVAALMMERLHALRPDPRPLRAVPRHRRRHCRCAGRAADAHEPPARGAGSGAAASRLRSAPAHLHRAFARQRVRSVSAAARRRRAG